MLKATSVGGSISHIGWHTGAFLWALAVVGVWVWATAYEFTTYAADESPSATHWPLDSQLALAQERPTLLFFMHPRCPCTRASVGELERILGDAQLAETQQPKLIVVVSLPQQASAQWRDTDTVRRASTLPRANVVWDVDGGEATRYGVVTSGAVRLYGPDGALLYSGGVTSSRGHEGSNQGSQRVRALLRNPALTSSTEFPVFGCQLCKSNPTTPCGDTCLPPLVEKSASTGASQ